MATIQPLQSIPDAAFDDRNCRFVLDEQGLVIHATGPLAARAGLPQGMMAGCALDSILAFREPDEVYHPGGLFGAKGSTYIDSIREGTHDVTLTPSGETVAVRFDRVRMPDGRRYLVGSVEPQEEEDSFALAGKLREFLSARPVPAPAKQDSPIGENELRHFFDMSNEVMAVSGVDGSFTRVNGAFVSILGYDDVQLSRLHFADLVHPEDRPQVQDRFITVSRQQRAIAEYEARMLAADGSVRWMQWRQQQDGGAVYSVGRDLTSAMAHEAALKAQAQQLSEAQAIAHMGHWQWAVGDETIVFSDEIYRIFGLDKDFVPSLDNLNKLLQKRDVGRLLQAFQRAIIERNNYEMEFTIQRPDGEARSIRCEGRCELDGENEVVALFGIMQDVTERTQHEAQLRQAKEAAERAYAAKSQFLANMSHELRTPLNAIIGFSEMMQRQLLGPIGTERYLDYISGIRESGEHLLDLISDILNMSKIEAGKYELALEELNPAKIIRMAAHMVEGRALEARITVTVDIDNEDILIVADRRGLMQILLNLLSNAIKFTDPNGLVHVSCLAKPGSDHILIRVQDTGIGIPANMLSAIARPFAQAANQYSRAHEGTGLGLAITKELAELHGGAMFIESTVDVGTTVTIRLPRNAYEHVKAKRKEKA